MREIYIDDTTQHISIGKESENDALAVYFPKQYYTETFGDGGTFMLLVKRPGKTEVPYFVELDTESKPGYVTWVVGNPDVALEGYGCCELHYIVGDTLAKSYTYTTLINRALGEGGDAPDPSTGWLESFYEAFDDVKEAVAVVPEIANLAAQATEAAENANAALVAAQAAQAECENIAVIGGYTRTEMDAMLAAKQDDLTFDETPADGSDNPVKSGGVYATVTALGSSVNSSIANLARDIDGEMTGLEQNTAAALANKSDAGHTHTASEITSGALAVERGGTGATTAAAALNSLGAAPVVHTHGEYAAASHTHAAGDITSGALSIERGGTGANTAAAARTALGAQAALTFDDVPAAGSSNPVKSSGIYAAIQNAGGGVVDTAMSNTSTHAVQNKVIAAALYNKADWGHTHLSDDIEGTIGIWQGGTGANTAAQALDNLGAAPNIHVHIADDIVSGTFPISRGGTGANTASGALTNLGAAAASHTHAAGDITSGALSIERGGTGATNAANARSNLGAAAASHTHSGYASSSHTHDAANISSGILSKARGGTGNGTGYIRAGLKSGVTAGDYSTAEGYNTSSIGSYSHAEGYNTVSNGSYAHSEGYSTYASGSSSHAGGYGTTAIGNYSFAHGRGCRAQGNYSAAFGNTSHANAAYSFAAGDYCMAMAEVSFLFGRHLSCASAGVARTTVGRYNAINESAQSLFIVGGGTSSTAVSNCFRVTTTGVYGAGAYNSSGADYAELFEWQDGNPDAEDRTGLFATLDGAKIRLVTSNDDFVLGIVSGNPSVVGDVFDDQWAGMYETDVFGRPIWETVDVPAEYDDGGNEITPAHTETRQKLNPEYDNAQKYKARTERPEWDAVGIIGKLVARDDGTCQVNGWAKPGPGAIATRSDTQTKYRVMERLDDSHIRVLIL